MKLPITLDELHKKAQNDMRRDPMHDLKLGYRLGIYSALGPRADLPDARDLRGYRRRVHLERLTAERLLPKWEKSLPEVNIPHRLISLAARVESGEVSVPEAWRLRDDWLTNAPQIGWPLRGVLAAAGDVLRTATVDIDFDETRPDFQLADDEDWDQEGGCRDAAGWGAYVEAGGAVHSAGADPEKRREFWEWWLTEAVPTSWRAVQ